MRLYRRSIVALLGAFVLYAVLVATHLGEFWPFSIYPMFSQGGNPWSRAVVREVTPEDGVAWTPTTAEALPGVPYPLLEHGVDPIDLSNFVSKTRTWDADRVGGLRRMFYADALGGRRLVVMRVDGRIEGGDSVAVAYVPVALLGADTTALNPALPTRAALPVH